MTKMTSQVARARRTTMRIPSAVCRQPRTIRATTTQRQRMRRAMHFRVEVKMHHGLVLHLHLGPVPLGALLSAAGIPWLAQIAYALHWI